MRFIRPRLFVAAAVVCCSGCASTVDVPRDRLGALPFPGLLTLYATADPARLGPHRYAHWPRLFRRDEAERGIIYTARAGFLDLAHVRIAIDWTRYCTLAVREAVASRRRGLALPGPDGAVFHVTLTYPPDRPDPPAAARERASDGLLYGIGQRVAYLMLTWHEMATWFGYRTVFFVDESPSAFTYDDSVSHLVGMRVAERAMCDRGRAFDEAVTVALDAELRRLGAVAPEQTDRAARAVEGLWWAAGGPLERQTHVYPGDAAVVFPWLVPGLPCCPAGTSPEPFPLPRVGSRAAAGRDEPVTASVTAEVAVEVAVEPRIGAAEAMRALLPGRPERFRDDDDLPALLRVVRAQMRARYGPAVDRPWPDDRVPARADGDPGHRPRSPPTGARDHLGHVPAAGPFGPAAARPAGG